MQIKLNNLIRKFQQENLDVLINEGRSNMICIARDMTANSTCHWWEETTNIFYHYAILTESSSYAEDLLILIKKYNF